MGITHHSNYIRFMEEARMAFLDEIGFPMSRIEAMGIGSPVVSLSCDYKRPTTYSDVIKIDLKIDGYTGVKLMFSYDMINTATGEQAACAQSVHCFTDENGRPVAVKKRFPELDAALKALADNK